MIEVFVHPVTKTPRPADYVIEDPRAAIDLADEFQDVDVLLMPVRDLEARSARWLGDSTGPLREALRSMEEPHVVTLVRS